MNQDSPNRSDQAVPDLVKQNPEPKNGWLNYVFQFILVFLAVMASFYAENLREEYGERQRAEDYAKSLIEDLIRDTQNMEYHVQRIKQAAVATDKLADYVRGKDLKHLNNLDLFRLSQIAPNPPFRWSRATMQQIKNSGSIRFFSSDSIVYYISTYDAITLHLDQDNIQDQQRFLEAADAKSRVVDSNYPELFRKLIDSNPDSLLSSAYYGQISNSSMPLLTIELNEIKQMVNKYLEGSTYLTARSEELLKLIKDEKRLIVLLKREYNLQ